MKLIVTLILLLACPALALAHHEAKPPKALNKIKVVERVYPDLHKKEVKRKNTSWNRLRKAAKREWINSHPYSDAAIYDYWNRTGNTYQTVQKVLTQKKVSRSTRSRINCQFKRESGFRHNVWYSGDQNKLALGWLNGRFAGTDRVNGVGQLRPFWANWWLGKCTDCQSRQFSVVTPETYHITSDPIASTKIALRIGPGPYYAQRGQCF